jgi:hypothetical protein
MNSGYGSGQSCAVVSRGGRDHRTWQVRYDSLHRPRDIFGLLADGSHVVQRRLGLLLGCCTQQYPSGKVLRGEAAAGRRDIAFGVKRLIEHAYSGLDDPWLRHQVSAGGSILEQPKFGQQ